MRHRFPGFAGIILIETSNYHSDASFSEFVDDRDELIVEKLSFVDADHLSASIEQVEKDCDRDNFMSSEEAKSYGLVDEVVQSRKEIPGLAERATSLADKKE